LETDRPQPNTEYGKSKLEAEQWLEEMLQTDRNSPDGNVTARDCLRFPEANGRLRTA
jgi:hypothetical protein